MAVFYIQEREIYMKLPEIPQAHLAEPTTASQVVPDVAGRDIVAPLEPVHESIDGLKESVDIPRPQRLPFDLRRVDL